MPQQLEFEYLIKDGYVFRPTIEDYRSLFEMRILIEKYAVEKAILLFNDEDIEVLRGYIEIARKGDEQDGLQASYNLVRLMPNYIQFLRRK